MNTIKINLILIISIFICFSCSEGVKKETIKTEVKPRMEGKTPSALNSLVSTIDTTLNPFANKLLFKTKDCKNEPGIDRINCVLSQFLTKPLPMHFGPVPEVNLGRNRSLVDSLFIVKALKDTNYFNEEERQYNYSLGIIIAHEYDFHLVIIPEWFNVGKNYIMLTISYSGEHIDKLVIGAESSDWKSVFGTIESLNNIQVTTKIIGLDQEKDLYYFSSSETQQYFINEKGRILKK